jgi:hypothetical protein
MEQPKTLTKLQAIKAEHKYETYRPYLGTETLARGERLEEILPKLAELRQEIEEYKTYLSAQRSEIYNKAVEYLKSIGLPDFEYKGKKMTKSTPAYLNEINMKLSEKYRYNDNYTLNEMSTMERFIKATLENKTKIERENAKKLEEGKRYEAILKLAEKYMTAEELKTAKALGTTTEQFEKYLAEIYLLASNGESISISSCDECETYTIGENRCSCGNRRISADAEAFYFNGEYHLTINTEPY